MHLVLLHNLTQPSSKPVMARYCQSFWCRLRGLTFQKQPDPGKGLLLVERADSRLDSSIHMLGVSVELGVVWINAAGEVVDQVLARPWRLAYAPRRPARYILETHPQGLKDYAIGDRVRFEEVLLD
jgi:uncharacterized membrane protein (UPF0127 family)